MRFVWILLLCALLPQVSVAQQSHLSQRQLPEKLKLPNIQFVVMDRDFVKYEEPKRTTPSPEPQIEIIYFYYYGSPWAYKIDKPLRTWAQTRPYNVKFITVPVYFDGNNYALLSARIHYALVALGQEQRLSSLFMQAVQENRVDLKKMSSVMVWMENHNVSKKEFLRALNSQEVKSSVAALASVAKRYGVVSTPSIVLEGQYLIAANEKRSPERVLALTKFMADKLSQGGPRP